MLLAFVGLAFGASRFEILPGDLAITRAIQTLDHPSFDFGMRALDILGRFPIATITTAVISILLAYRGLRSEALAAVGAGLSSLTNILFKVLVSSPRPTPDLVVVRKAIGEYGFPSGHVMYFTVFYGFLLYLVWKTMKPSAWQTFLMILLGAIISLGGVSRIYLGVHWPTDVFGAYLIGGLFLGGFIWLHQKVKQRLH